MMSDASFNLYQQVITLSMLVNAEGGVANQPAEQLQAELLASVNGRLADPGLQALIGNWTVPWGPYVYQEPGDKDADNAMLVAYNADEEVYVVAVAATNFISRFDWLKEDLQVTPPLVTWPTGNTTGAAVSTGTSIGVGNLLALPQVQGPTPGPSLRSFLSTGVQNKSTVVFTGHSLGGALAPALALELVADGTLQGWSSVYVYPTAGPTPGNAAFVQAFGTAFPLQAPQQGQAWQAFNGLVWNQYDVVPHAWQADLLAQIPTLYAGDTPNCIQKLFTAYGAPRPLDPQSGVNPYQQIASSGFLPGTLVGTPVPLALNRYIKQAIYQHVYAYFDLLGVQALLQLKDSSGASLFNPPQPFVAFSKAAVEADALAAGARLLCAALGVPPEVDATESNGSVPGAS